MRKLSEYVLGRLMTGARAACLLSDGYRKPWEYFSWAAGRSSDCETDHRRFADTWPCTPDLLPYYP
jgi:hypothetical protein